MADFHTNAGEMIGQLGEEENPRKRGRGRIDRKAGRRPSGGGGAGEDREEVREDEKEPQQAKKRKIISSSRTWDDFFRSLKRFKKQNGHCNVPFRYNPDRSLGNWVVRVRAGTSKITSKQKKRLDKLGFDWETMKEKDDRRWNELFQRLKAHRRQHGCFDGFNKKDKKERQLGNWVTKQRSLKKNGKLQRDRERELDSIQFAWTFRAFDQSRRSSDNGHDPQQVSTEEEESHSKSESATGGDDSDSSESESAGDDNSDSSDGTLRGFRSGERRPNTIRKEMETMNRQVVSLAAEVREKNEVIQRLLAENDAYCRILESLKIKTCDL